MLNGRANEKLGLSAREECAPESLCTGEADGFAREHSSPNAKEKKDDSLIRDADIDEAIASRAKNRKEIRANLLSFISSEREKGTENISLVIENMFYQEKVNADWARDKEAKISDRFANDEELKGIYPLEVSCRSENCKIVLPIQNQDNVSSISSRLSGVQIDGEGEDSVIYSFPDEATNRLIVYVSKSEGMNIFE